MTTPIAIIQAGGKGTRLHPYTAVLPKPLMPIDDLPVLEIVVRQLVYHGIENLYVTTGHLAHLIEAFFGDGSKWGASITYVREDMPLGTIGPVRSVPCPSEPFIVMNGDLLTDIDYRVLYDYHLASDALLTVATYHGEIPVSLGVIEYDDQQRIIAFREKPRLHFWASMGVYVFSPELWEMIPPDIHYGFDDLMADMLANNLRAQVYPWDGRWLDIGRPEDYAKATDEFVAHREKFLPEERPDQ
jgi:NDP-sugar pyrophosphorylase family protein